METITLLKKECRLQFTSYNNKTVAIEAIKVRGGDRWVIPTVNYEKMYFGIDYAEAYSFPFVVIKNYGELSGVYDELEQQGVVTMGFPISNNHLSVMACLLTEKWEKIAKEQLQL
jgi:hypothetical protein